MDRWLVVAQTVGIPLIAFLGRIWTALARNRRLERQVEHHAKLVAELPDDLQQPLHDLLSDEIDALVNVERRRLTRKVDWAVVATIIFITLVAGGVFAGGMAVGRWWSIVPAAAIALFLTILVIVGTFQIYKYPDDGNDGARRAG